LNPARWIQRLKLIGALVFSPLHCMLSKFVLMDW
jgi:hypothetical protein